MNQPHTKIRNFSVSTKTYVLNIKKNPPRFATGRNKRELTNY